MWVWMWGWELGGGGDVGCGYCEGCGMGNMGGVLK